jgi:hypothetical protein
MEHTFFWMSRLGFWVVWSVHYNQLLEQLSPAVLSDFPSAQCQAEFDRLCARPFFSRNPSSSLLEDTQPGINPLDAPAGITRLRLIPWEDSSSDVRSRLQPDPASNVASARGATVRCSFSGVLEYLHGELFLASRNHRVFDRFFPQSWRPQTDNGLLQRNWHLPGTSWWAKSWTWRSPPQDYYRRNSCTFISMFPAVVHLNVGTCWPASQPLHIYIYVGLRILC